MLTVRDGRLAGADGAGDASARFLALLDAHGPLGRNLAEIGVGTNDRARVTGNILEDEKILGTTHVAFGASAGIGGTVFELLPQLGTGKPARPAVLIDIAPGRPVAADTCDVREEARVLGLVLEDHRLRGDSAHGSTGITRRSGVPGLGLARPSKLLDCRWRLPAPVRASSLASCR